nr:MULTISPECIES: hypothetical protein [unclassified Streptomyces]
MVDGLCDGARKPTEIHLSARSATSWLSAHTRTFG